MNNQVYVDIDQGNSVGRKYINYMGFHIPKIWQILNGFSEPFLCTNSLFLKSSLLPSFFLSTQLHAGTFKDVSKMID